MNLKKIYIKMFQQIIDQADSHNLTEKLRKTLFVKCRPEEQPNEGQKSSELPLSRRRV